MSAPSLRQPDLGREIWQVSPNSVDLESWGGAARGGIQRERGSLFHVPVYFIMSTNLCLRLHHKFL